MRRRLNNVVEEIDGCLYYMNRPIISRDTPINGGVYLGSAKREALVVDFEKDVYLNNLYEEAKLGAKINGRVSKHLIIPSVYSSVKRSMPSSKGYKLLLDRFDLRNDKKVYLGSFIAHRTGVCRHKALACAALLERFIKEGYLSGNVSIDRNNNGKSAHAWTRYTCNNGTVVILDVALGYLGPLVGPNQRWDYRRKDDT